MLAQLGAPRLWPDLPLLRLSHASSSACHAAFEEAQKALACDRDAVLFAHRRRCQHWRSPPIAVWGTAKGASVWRLDQARVEEVGRLVPTVQAADFQRTPMRRTLVFALQLIQHAVIAVCRALPTISEKPVIPIPLFAIEQGCAQHLHG